MGAPGDGSTDGGLYWPDHRPEKLTSDAVVQVDTWRVLDGAWLFEMLASYAETAMGRGHVLALKPVSLLSQLEERHDQVAEARARVRSSGYLALADAVPIAAILSSTRAKGNVIELQELLAVARTARVANSVRAELGLEAAEYPALIGPVRGLPNLNPLVRQIDALLTPSGEIRDNASVELVGLRRRQRRLQAQIRQRLERLLQEDRLHEAVHDPLVTQRSGRFVIPVRADRKESVRGVVHGTSSSGQTLYVEPLDTVEDQNRLSQLAAEAEREIVRLIADVSGHVCAAADALRSAEQLIGMLDGIQALARYAEEVGACRPQFVKGGMRLLGARHPLFDSTARGRLQPIETELDNLEEGDDDAGEYVPLDLDLAADMSALVITGPNTGGKTIVLKTVGLVALMAQCGVPVPACEAALPIFPRIHADIGDEQSIESNLSTFSGHLTRILQCLADCPPSSLVLLDELGTGTDPAEGAALGIALLERFVEQGALILVSTHHDALKAFAHGSESVLNAAMEFEVETLRPTYRLLAGRPGRSGALEIAARLGLAPDLVQRARGLLHGQAVRLDTLIQELQRESEETAEVQEQLRAQRQGLKAAISRHEEADRQLREARSAFERRAQQKIRRVVAKLREEGERRLDEIENRIGQVDSDRTRSDRRAQWGAVTGMLGGEAARKAREGIESNDASCRERSGEGHQELDDLHVAPGRDLEGRSELTPWPEMAAARHDDGTLAGRPLNRGADVRVAPFNLVGTVCTPWSPSDGEANVEVDVGGKRLIATRKNVTVLRSSVPTSAYRGGTRFPHRQDVENELHVRRCTVEEALEMVERYLDTALLAELPFVRLIHGYGKGKLRQALHEWLRGRPGVATYRLGEPGEGGGGVTIVELDV